MIGSALVGTLEVDPGGGFFGEVILNDSEETLQLSIHEDVSADSKLLGDAVAILDRFRSLEMSARGALRGRLAPGVDDDVIEFVRFHAEDLELLDGNLRSVLSEFLVDGGRVNDVAHSFRTRGMVFHTGDDGELEFWIDLSLAPEQSDEVLCVRFNASQSVTAIDWES